MANDKKILKHDDFLASKVDIALRDFKTISDDTFDDVYILQSLVHHHDGGMGQIVWNDVQAIIAKNRYVRDGKKLNLKVPETATEGYNQHSHTSEFDGGIIPGIMGVHDHRDNVHGGLAYACFAPATSLPQAVWES